MRTTMTYAETVLLLMKLSGVLATLALCCLEVAWLAGKHKYRKAIVCSAIICGLLSCASFCVAWSIVAEL